MNTKTKIYQMIDGFSDSQLNQVYAILSSVKHMLDEQPSQMEMGGKQRTEKESVCTESVQMEDVAKELGILFE